MHMLSFGHTGDVQMTQSENIKFKSNTTQRVDHSSAVITTIKHEDIHTIIIMKTHTHTHTHKHESGPNKHAIIIPWATHRERERENYI